MSVQHKTLSDISVKRKITEAGRIMSAIAPQVKRLDELKTEIKRYMEVGLRPGSSLTLVSGEYVASLSAEKKAREIDQSVIKLILAEVGMSKFLDMVNISAAELNKAFTDTQLDEMAPKKYTGGGRQFKLTERS